MKFTENYMIQEIYPPENIPQPWKFSALSAQLFYLISLLSFLTITLPLFTSHYIILAVGILELLLSFITVDYY